jgi:TRAP-type C4-dicarboxylate transport system permease small subunit
MAWTSGAGIVLLMLPTVADVSYRKIVGPSLPGMIEVSEVALVVLAFLAMGPATAAGSHIATPILTMRLAPGLARALRVCGMVAVWGILAVMIWGTARNAMGSVAIREFRFGMVQMPIWPAKLAVPLGLGAMLVELTLQIADALRRPAGRPR